MDNIQNEKQTLILKDRETLELNGVKSVNSFDVDYLELNTNLSILCVEGNNLKIEALDHENQKILLKGRINGIFYKEEKTSRGFFSGLFK